MSKWPYKQFLVFNSLIQYDKLYRERTSDDKRHHCRQNTFVERINNETPSGLIAYFVFLLYPIT